MSFPKLKILDLRHSYDLIRTPDFSGLLVLEMLVLEDCINLVQFHESIGDLQSLLILNLRNCKSLVELPDEVSRLNSLQKLVLDGCSNLDGMNIELEQLQPWRLLQRDGTVANTSNIAARLLKSFIPSWFSTRKNLRFTTFSLPCSLMELNLGGTPIRSLPESIKGLNTLNLLRLRNCQMLQTLPELPSNLLAVDASSCYSLQRVTNLIRIVIQEDCDQLVQVQHLIKLELIQKFNVHMLRIMETVSLQIQPSVFQIKLEDNLFIVLLQGYEFLRFYEEEDEWLIWNEFQQLSFKIYSPSEHQIRGFDLFVAFFTISEFSSVPTVNVEIENDTKGRKWVFRPHRHLGSLDATGEFLIFSHLKCGAEFDNGDEVSVSVHTNVPGIQIKTVGVRKMYEEEGNNHNIQSNNAYSSSANNEVIIANNCSSSWDNQALGDEHVAKAQIASHVFRNYYCKSRFNGRLKEKYFCSFLKK